MKTVWIGLLVCLVSAALVRPISALEWGPWSVNSGAPVMASREIIEPPRTGSDRRSLPAKFLIRSVRFFQTVISPVDGTRCTMTPTCSHFSIQAIEAHGPFVGFMMTADRIVHEQEEQQYVPIVRHGTRLRYYDPVQNNDFWFAHGSKNEQPLRQQAEGK